jgi:hypothetical protein
MGVDLGLPQPEPGTRPGAHGAALDAVGAVLGAAVGIDVKRLVLAAGVVVGENIVGAGDDARGTARAQS